MNEMMKLLRSFPPESLWGLDPLFWIPTKWHIKNIYIMRKHPLYSGNSIFYYNSCLGIKISNEYRACLLERSSDK